MRKILLIFALILVLIGLTAAVGMPGVEMKPGEAAAEKLFEKGFGQPWVGGNPLWYQGTYGQFKKPLTLPIKKSIASSISYYPLGSVYGNGYLTIGYGQGALTIPYSPSGYYQTFGCYDSSGRLIGVYIDLAGYYG
ncbi:MAG: hypothetical protein ACE14P_07580 [Methanotrichaceae archaeon]